MQVKIDALQTLPGSAIAQHDVQPQFLSADASDPQVIGWMQGSPPVPEKVVRFSSILQFPQTRWSFSHLRELLPSVQVARGKEQPARYLAPNAETSTPWSSPYWAATAL